MDESELRDFLYGLSPEDLLLGFSAPGGMYRAPALYLDGHVLPARPLLETLADPAAVANVPVISGSNRDEAKLFMAVNGIYVVRHWGVMFEIRDLEVYEGVASLLSDHWRLTGVDQPLDALAAAHPGQQYAYRFDWDESGSGRIADMPTLMGAAHGFELPFVFGDFSDLWGIPLLFPEEYEAGRLELSAAMMDYWSHFAYTGSPDTGRVRQQPPWPGWDVSTGRALRLDTPAGGGIEPLELRLDLADLHERFVGLQERIPEAARCGLYAYLFWKTAEWEPARFEGLEPYCRGKTASDLAADPFGE
ncbi:MAG: carboxylesterase family protein [Pseudomonadota bacterium]